MLEKCYITKTPYLPFVSNTIMFVLQILYKEEFEKNKGKAYSQVADTPEFLRVKKTQDQISNVSVSNSHRTNILNYSRRL